MNGNRLSRRLKAWRRTMYNRPVRHRHRGWTAYRARYGAQSCQRRREEWTYARRITTEHKYKLACQYRSMENSQVSTKPASGHHELKIRSFVRDRNDPRNSSFICCGWLPYIDGFISFYCFS